MKTRLALIEMQEQQGWTDKALLDLLLLEVCGLNSKAQTRLLCRMALREKPKELSQETKNELDSFSIAYLEGALFSTTNGGTDTPLDRDYTYMDFSEQFVQMALLDCEEFVEANESLWEDDPAANDEDVAGRFFWYARNHHGRTFCDGEFPLHGKTLQENAQAFGENDFLIQDHIIGYVTENDEEE